MPAPPWPSHREEVAEGGHRGGSRLVEDPGAPLLAVQQAALVQHLQVVADGRLREVEEGQQVAHAGLATLVREHQRQQSEPGGISDRLQHGNHPGRLLDADRLAGQGHAARQRIVGEREFAACGDRVRHGSMLTHVDVRRHVGSLGTSSACRCPTRSATWSRIARTVSRSWSAGSSSSHSWERYPRASAFPRTTVGSPAAAASAAPARATAASTPNIAG